MVRLAGGGAVLLLLLLLPEPVDLEEQVEADGAQHPHAAEAAGQRHQRRVKGQVGRRAGVAELGI